jgi:hypothetical protein
MMSHITNRAGSKTIVEGDLVDCYDHIDLKPGETVTIYSLPTKRLKTELYNACRHEWPRDSFGGRHHVVARGIVKKVGNGTATVDVTESFGNF